MTLAGEFDNPSVNLVEPENVIDDEFMSESVVVKVLGLSTLSGGFVDSVEFGRVIKAIKQIVWIGPVSAVFIGLQRKVSISA